MPRIVSVFCDTSVPLRAILNAIEETLQIRFLMKENEGVGVVFESAYDGAVIVAFEEHGLEDDSGIEFTKYSIEIDLSGGQSEVNLLETGLKIAERLSEQIGCPTIVVNNLQQLRAAYHSPI